MKNTTTNTNSKGQLVIPVEMRRELHINPDVMLHVQLAGGGIHIYPVADVITKTAAESSYGKLLEKTRGAWGTVDESDLSEKRAKLEIAASKRRKQTW
ncbi:AbrB/MazE/SpoVT family DNA-binding domain-containing protein [Candidatus Saccharibacteria bacterium]|nr:AbrB/MazE/SpoVT family DNA-binding domain-containing protein [Candidatus Saccharibacteria bacterium]